MLRAPNYSQFLSTKLAEVLADIGVDERMVQKRKRTWLLIESLYKANFMLRDKTVPIYLLGSQAEGTTTLGLSSDSDRVICFKDYHVIQDLSEWQPGLRNLLMIQDNTVLPGYCLLQCIRSDAPLPLTGKSNKHRYNDETGRLLLRNAIILEAEDVFDRGAVRGPAHASKGENGYIDTDTVAAFPCTSWPLQAGQWLKDRQGKGIWPSAEMKQTCTNFGCFVVGVGVGGSENEALEWRISTSLAERHLMFSLNITQIRCYILMKMLIKTYINSLIKDAISSYMCKTVLFHCIANTHSSSWRENNLLVCLSRCLLGLYNCVLTTNCPHFIIPGNNLMRGKFSSLTKLLILGLLRYIINRLGVAMLEISYDDFGIRLKKKFSNIRPFQTGDTISGILVLNIVWHYYHSVNEWQIELTTKTCEETIQSLKKNVVKLICFQGEGLDKMACTILARWYSSWLESVLGSLSIHQNGAISKKALSWIYLGQKKDATSTQLKLASMLYCVKDLQRTIFALNGIVESYDITIIEPVCCCYIRKFVQSRKGYNTVSYEKDVDAIHLVAALCVQFLPCEMYCAPKELRYEMFRSTKEEKSFQRLKDYWMNWAVVDSLPYLYFLQYKVYRDLEMEEDKQQALDKLFNVIDNEPTLGHKETALNLMGQCMEDENRVHTAIQCYLLSLDVREKNNAAKIHICKLLSKLVNTMT